NLAGHNFPSGVSFRRAFINFQVLDGAGNVLWASGNTNSDGVIVDNSGNPLVTEFFSPTQQSFQPHFWTGNPITTDSQVQVYEELATDPQGLLTTSFPSWTSPVRPRSPAPLFLPVESTTCEDRRVAPRAPGALAAAIFRLFSGFFDGNLAESW